MRAGRLAEEQSDKLVVNQSGLLEDSPPNACFITKSMIPGSGCGSSDQGEVSMQPPSLEASILLTVPSHLRVFWT